MAEIPRDQDELDLRILRAKHRVDGIKHAFTKVDIDEMEHNKKAKGFQVTRDGLKEQLELAEQELKDLEAIELPND